MNETIAPGNRKIAVGGVAGAFVTILVFLIETSSDIKIPPEVATAIGIILTATSHQLLPHPRNLSRESSRTT